MDAAEEGAFVSAASERSLSEEGSESSGSEETLLSYELVWEISGISAYTLELSHHIWVLYVYFDMEQKMCYNTTVCSEGKSFVRNDGPDKARTEMSVLIRPFFCLKGGCINEWIS